MDQPKVFEDFHRVVAAFGEGSGFYVIEPKGAARVLFAHDREGTWFYLTAVLRDGRTEPFVVPRSWKGRITRKTIAQYFGADTFDLSLRKSGKWGLHWKVEKALGPRGYKVFAPVQFPLIDPVRDATQPDDERWLPVALSFKEPWNSLFTRWEALDAFMATKTPGEEWLRHRIRHAVGFPARSWLQIRGLHEARNADRYKGQWEDKTAITAYLGWPAYFIDAAGEVRRCRCGGTAIGGRTYCGDPDCNRERARQRQRDRRNCIDGHEEVQKSGGAEK